MEVAPPNPVGGVAPTGTAKAPEKPEEAIPEVIEERRKDSEGRVGVYRYMRGKLLGKVRLIVQQQLCLCPVLTRFLPKHFSGWVCQVLLGHLAAKQDPVRSQDRRQELAGQA